ncbi:MAG: hypothetical protein IKF80_02535 [Erysipelotrichaceae bacterium]|nr:hypothetical protein [Erysipelotrichaceae bacterium]
MITERRLLGLALIPLSATLILYFVLQKSNYSERRKQIIVGVIFGIIAIIATEFGVPYNGTIINVRDAAPLCAGLFFGPLAGIISGLIGGIERWFCVYWGGGYYTRVACSISTVVVGFIAAYFRNYMFANRSPEWYLALFIGYFSETFHMIMIFLTNLEYVKTAFTYVQTCSGPMILINAITVGLAAFFIQRIERESLNKRAIPTLSSQYQRSLIAVVVAGFIVTTSTTYVIERQLSLIETFNETIDSILEVYSDGEGRLNERMQTMAKEIAEDFYHDLNYDIDWLCNYYGVDDVVIFDTDGNILESTNKSYLGKNIKNLKGLDVLTDYMEYKEYLRSETFATGLNEVGDEGTLRKYCGIYYEDKLVAVAYGKENYDKNLNRAMDLAVNYHRVGE